MSKNSTEKKTLDEQIADQRAAGQSSGVVIAPYTDDDALADAVADRLADLDAEGTKCPL